MELVTQLHQLPDHFIIFVSSRPEQPILHAWEDFEGPLHIDDLNAIDAESDIRHYVLPAMLVHMNTVAWRPQIWHSPWCYPQMDVAVSQRCAGVCAGIWDDLASESTYWWEKLSNVVQMVGQSWSMQWLIDQPASPICDRSRITWNAPGLLALGTRPTGDMRKWLRRQA